MPLLKPILLMLAASALTASAVADDGVVNIANVKGARETQYSPPVRGWKIVVGTVKGKAAYCTAISKQGGADLRFGYDGGQWQMAVKYGARRGEFAGTMEIDGKQSGTYGVSDGQWTFLWLNLGERDALMNGKQAIFEVGKASLDYSLNGAAAAALKVEECVQRRVTVSAVRATIWFAWSMTRVWSRFIL